MTAAVRPAYVVQPLSPGTIANFVYLSAMALASLS
jgi:hypothetical protein